MTPRIHLAVQSSGQPDFASLVHLARTAERGLFDFVLLADGGFTMLAALAAVTDRLGLVGTVDATSDEPSEVARQLATLEHLSDGRAGWLVGDVEHAGEFVDLTRAFLDSWDPGAVVADDVSGIYVDPALVHPVGQQGALSLPAGPRGQPVLVRAGFAVADFGLSDPDRVATAMELHVQSGACDGFLVASDDLDEFVDSVVPLLQQRGVVRTEYAGSTLREHLGL
jgi:alkanesulfonate monooxygenase SsuD/methylene tetrahydromethanopterin reductase-like flavin-dependent oxidoreductase (luciferase family)